ncbi:hypothetical protein BDV23DRAFT_188014 [Aspergillus alliaceus]|uniref:Uncharacterized protein n=1 Tax=Petromyces alliaceus TaxID=209559 RepID=A0A5N7BVV2_PETAA|nr:hypothetical protein BDV23DRAFT_188014 [Aspergillus alliaceus]
MALSAESIIAISVGVVGTAIIVPSFILSLQKFQQKRHRSRASPREVSTDQHATILGDLPASSGNTELHLEAGVKYHYLSRSPRSDTMQGDVPLPQVPATVVVR